MNGNFSPEEINEASGRSLKHAVPATDNISPAEPGSEDGQDYLESTTSNGELSFVGLTLAAKQDNVDGIQKEDGPRLSERATRKEPTNPVMMRLGEMMKDAHKDDNPNGIISLGVAENSLMDVILTSSPYYLGFDKMRAGGVLVGVPMDIDADGWECEGDVEARMERAWQKCQERGLKVKAVIVTNPGNPIGRTQLPNAVPFTSILNIDIERELGTAFFTTKSVFSFTVPDILPLISRFGTLISQHNPECIRAVMSVALFMKVSSPADTLFYAMLSSPPPDISPSEASDSSAVALAIKSATDAINPDQPAEVENSFAAWFVAENRRRLTDSAAYMSQWFIERGFKVYPANAGHFLWVDFGDRVGWDTWEKELDGFNGLFERRVYIVSPPSRIWLRGVARLIKADITIFIQAPGSVFHSAKPGKMRVSFTVERKLMDKGLGRLDEYLSFKE
ncbi:hypothetical protein QFC19_003577 [Naganishia cerealis]|uniref:Uncharacterized protein n=1 Tax=Naganishia cerealis TaxID=610337 RepID=A0ACC2W1H9_9TREE|nr:hypothetical protein QFC19_003577 [Naganishia cerealis]